MTEVWPADVHRRLLGAPTDTLRPPRVLLLMPFAPPFDDIATLIHDTTNAVFQDFKDFFGLPEIARLDWVSSSGAIQEQIWRKIIEADLVICDLTDYNANVMFESGVSAAWKAATQVIFIKDRAFTTSAPFDIKPMRYTEYERTYTGIKTFQQQLATLIREAFISFPDRSTVGHPRIPAEYVKDFGDGREDLSIVTAPFSHRRITGGLLEFGSLWSFPHSWATIGKEHFHEFILEFTAAFRNPHDGDAYIGVGVRSQHYYANFAHILYLKHNGSIVITEPNEDPPSFYKDNVLREATPIDPAADHHFKVVFGRNSLRIVVDNFKKTFPVGRMRKVLGPGLIRFQSSRTWMGLRSVSLKTLSPAPLKKRVPPKKKK